MSLLSRSSLHRRPELVSLLQRLPILPPPPLRARLPPPAPSSSPAPPSMASSDLVHLLRRQCRLSPPILTPATISSPTRSAKITLFRRLGFRRMMSSIPRFNPLRRDSAAAGNSRPDLAVNPSLSGRFVTNRGNESPRRLGFMNSPASADGRPFQERTMASTERPGFTGSGGFRNLNFVQSILEEDEQNSRNNRRDIVNISLSRKKTFVTVTDSKGNKKLGASAGSLQTGKVRASRYAAEATVEHVGRAARNMGVTSVVIRVKGFTFFSKKKKAIFSWREGFKGEGVNGESRILAIHDVTQLPHNGCRLRKKRRL